MSTNQELFHQWLSKKRVVSSEQVITKLVQLGEIEEAKVYLNKCKDVNENIFGEMCNLYDDTIKFLSPSVLKKLKIEA